MNERQRFVAYSALLIASVILLVAVSHRIDGSFLGSF